MLIGIFPFTKNLHIGVISLNGLNKFETVKAFQYFTKMIELKPHWE